MKITRKKFLKNENLKKKKKIKSKSFLKKNLDGESPTKNYGRKISKIIVSSENELKISGTKKCKKKFLENQFWNNNSRPKILEKDHFAPKNFKNKKKSE